MCLRMCVCPHRTDIPSAASNGIPYMTAYSAMSAICSIFPMITSDLRKSCKAIFRSSLPPPDQVLSPVPAFFPSLKKSHPSLPPVWSLNASLLDCEPALDFLALQTFARSICFAPELFRPATSAHSRSGNNARGWCGQRGRQLHRLSTASAPCKHEVRLFTGCGKIRVKGGITQE